MVCHGMATESDDADTTLSPDDAFAVLGNETRMDILQTLAEAEDPLPFSELRERVGVSDSGQFNYHLDRLVGHFLEDTEDGYRLRRAGERIIEAVVSGAVTETPVIESTEVDWPCSQCGAPTEVSYQQERVAASCTECPGLYAGSSETHAVPDELLEHGYLGEASLPPAAIEGRNASEVFRTAISWDFLERIARSKGICPRCSAAIEMTLTVCESHDHGDGICDTCGSRYAVKYECACPNCPHTGEGLLPTALHGNTEVLDFITSHGFDPVTPTEDQWMTMSDSWVEEVLCWDPIEVRITYTLEGHVLSLTVDEGLDVIDVTETQESASG